MRYDREAMCTRVRKLYESHHLRNATLSNISEYVGNLRMALVILNFIGATDARDVIEKELQEQRHDANPRRSIDFLLNICSMFDLYIVAPIKAQLVPICRVAHETTSQLLEGVQIARVCGIIMRLDIRTSMPLLPTVITSTPSSIQCTASNEIELRLVFRVSAQGSPQTTDQSVIILTV